MHYLTFQSISLGNPAEGYQNDRVVLQRGTCGESWLREVPQQSCHSRTVKSLQGCCISGPSSPSTVSRSATAKRY